jgi:hypothetical protein
MRTQGDYQSVLNQDDRGRRLGMEKTELARKLKPQGLKKLTEKLARKRLSAEAEVDSVDSLICTRGFYMGMREINCAKRDQDSTLSHARLSQDD